MKYDLVISALKEDVLKVLSNLEYIKKFIDYDSIVFIGNDEVLDIINNTNYKNIKFINENLMLEKMNFKSVKNLILKCGGNPKRTGWYFQQFLKLGYSRICDNKYYMVWDADTVPVKKVQMFNKNKIPLFHLKTEYHKPYFVTILIEIYL